MPRKPTTKKQDAPSSPPPTWETPALQSKDLRMSYRIARGEQGVLTVEPYKSFLLPHWRFRTFPIAQTSSQTLYAAFAFYVEVGDFVGADMARKFVQMGMTRAKRYANHAGGRKYAKGKGGERERVELPRSEGHEGREEKLAASEVFREMWRRCTADEGYVRLRKEFQREQREWDRVKKEEEEGGEDVEVKGEDEVEVKEEEGDVG